MGWFLSVSLCHYRRHFALTTKTRRHQETRSILTEGGKKEVDGDQRRVHTMFYSSEPEALRAFIRDKLGFPYTDVGDGWLIFNLPEADMGCHPSDTEDGQPSGTHYISFYCDDIEKTVAELRSRGVEFSDEITDVG